MVSFGLPSRPSRKVTNSEVARLWGMNVNARSGNMTSKDGSLYSYGLEIGRELKGRKVAYDYTAKGRNFKSKTTSRHVRCAKMYADGIANPLKGRY